MKWRDTIEMAVHNLLQRRGRSVLNLLGVVVGCTMLLMAAAGGQGVIGAIESLFERSEFARQIHGSPDHEFGQADVPDDAIQVKGDMSEKRRKRISKVLQQEWKSENRTRKTYGIDSNQLDAVELMPHVSEVIPNSWITGVLSQDGVSCFGGVEGTSLIGDLKDRIVAGSLPSTVQPDEALIDDVSAWKLGYVNDTDLENLIGQKVTLTIQNNNSAAMGLIGMFGRTSGFDAEQFLQQLQVGDAIKALLEELDSTSLTDEQKKLIRNTVASFSSSAADLIAEGGEPGDARNNDSAVTQTFTICGVYEPADGQNIWKLFRQTITGNRNGLLVSPQSIRQILESSGSMQNVYSVFVTVDRTQHLEQVTTSMKEIGFRTHSALQVLKAVNESIGQSLLVIYGIAGIILLTTCLGICNTLFVSILERTPEFGIMKSLGAEDHHIRRLMLCEGAALGIVGAAVSVSISWILGKIGDSILRSHVEGQINESLNNGLFHFGLLPIVLVTILAVLICVVASLIPAIRASRLDPVVAMRRQ